MNRLTPADAAAAIWAFLAPAIADKMAKQQHGRIIRQTRALLESLPDFPQWSHCAYHRAAVIANLDRAEAYRKKRSQARSLTANALHNALRALSDIGAALEMERRGKQ